MGNFLTLKLTSQQIDPCVLNPGKESNEKSLPLTGILACNPSDAGCFNELASRHGLSSGFLFHSKLYANENFFLAGPAVGAPMAVLCLEKLIALGAKKIILYGWCGSLQKELRAMDTLAPTSCFSEEGTSNHYPQDSRKGKIAPSVDLHGRLCKGLTENKVAFQKGAVWTTDAPYRETEKKIADYAARGILGVDMEFSALCAVAAFRGAELAAVMLVSDELWNRPWKPQYSFKSFKKRSRERLSLLCDLAPLL